MKSKTAEFMEKRRVYVYKELYEQVVDFAYERWKKYQDRALNGQPLHKSFPESLQKFIEESQKK